MLTYCGFTLQEVVRLEICAVSNTEKQMAHLVWFGY